MGLPNCSRSFAYWFVISSTACAAPTMVAVCRTAACNVAADNGSHPWPSTPTRFSAGVDTSSKVTAYSACPAMFRIFSRSMPRAPASTSSNEMPSASVAAPEDRGADDAVAMRDRREERAPLVLGPGGEEQRARHRHGVEVGARNEEPAHLLVDGVQVEEAATASSVRFGEGDAQPAELRQLPPALARVADVAVLDLAHDLGRVAPPKELVRGPLQEELVFVEREIDGHAGPTAGGRGRASRRPSASPATCLPHGCRTTGGRCGRFPPRAAPTHPIGSGPGGRGCPCSAARTRAGTPS